jgi:Cys-tRNA synthase (O-phospho-L-seryl-tRNA:Cys-tRNA synthase)
MKEQSPKKPPIKTAMRLPAELHADLKEAAEREDHSMNDEIILRCTAMSGGASLATILAQTQRLSEENRQLKAEIQKTQQMVQSIIDALGPGRKR